MVELVLARKTSRYSPSRSLWFFVYFYFRYLTQVASGGTTGQACADYSNVGHWLISSNGRRPSVGAKRLSHQGRLRASAPSKAPEITNNIPGSKHCIISFLSYLYPCGCGHRNYYNFLRRPWKCLRELTKVLITKQIFSLKISFALIRRWSLHRSLNL